MYKLTFDDKPEANTYVKWARQKGYLVEGPYRERLSKKVKKFDLNGKRKKYGFVVLRKRGAGREGGDVSLAVLDEAKRKKLKAAFGGGASSFEPGDREWEYQLSGAVKVVSPKLIRKSKAKMAEIRGYAHTIKDLETIASGTGTIKTYHGAPTEFAKALVRKGANVPYKAEDVAKEVAKAYDLPWKEFKHFAYRQGTIDKVSTAPAAVASRWAQHFPQGEVMSELNDHARLVVEAKKIQRKGESLEDAYNRYWKEIAEPKLKAIGREGMALGRQIDYLGLPDKLQPKSGTGALVELTVDVKDLPDYTKHGAKHVLKALKEGELTPEQAAQYWGESYQDMRIDPKAIKSARIVVKGIPAGAEDIAGGQITKFPSKAEYSSEKKRGSPKGSGKKKEELYHGTYTGLPEKDISKFGGIHIGTRKAAEQRLEDIEGSSRVGGRLPTKQIIPVEVNLKKPYGSKKKPIDETKLFLLLNQKGKLQELKDKGFDGIIYRNIAEDPGSVSYLVFDRKNIEVKQAKETKGKAKEIPIQPEIKKVRTGAEPKPEGYKDIELPRPSPRDPSARIAVDKQIKLLKDAGHVVISAEGKGGKIGYIELFTHDKPYHRADTPTDTIVISRMVTEKGAGLDVLNKLAKEILEYSSSQKMKIDTGNMFEPRLIKWLKRQEKEGKIELTEMPDRRNRYTITPKEKKAIEHQEIPTQPEIKKVMTGAESKPTKESIKQFIKEKKRVPLKVLREHRDVVKEEQQKRHEAKEELETKKLKVSVSSPRYYWDAHLEGNPLRTGRHDTDAGAFTAWMIESAGDVLRESYKQKYSDPSYIHEKLNRIGRELSSRDWTDPISAGEQERLAKTRKLLEDLPAKTHKDKVIKRLIEGTVKRDREQTSEALREVKQHLVEEKVIKQSIKERKRVPLKELRKYREVVKEEHEARKEAKAYKERVREYRERAEKADREEAKYWEETKLTAEQQSRDEEVEALKAEAEAYEKSEKEPIDKELEKAQ